MNEYDRRYLMALRQMIMDEAEVQARSGGNHFVDGMHLAARALGRMADGHAPAPHIVVMPRKAAATFPGYENRGQR